MRTSWDALAIGEDGLTATLAGFSAVYFLRRHARGTGVPGRQTATLALGMSAAGAAVLAVHGIATAVGGGNSAGVSLLVGLPALTGQALMALMVMRRKRGQ